MRKVILTSLAALCLAIGCKEETAKPTTPAPAGNNPTSANPPRLATPTAVPTTRSPNNDKKDIQGVWDSKPDEKYKNEPVQFEFTETELIIRTGPGPDWKQKAKVPYTLRNEIAPPQIDWGTGTDAGYGLYSLDGKSLNILYATNGPESRPKRFEPSKTAKLVMFEKAK